MATESLTCNFVIDNPVAAEKFISIIAEAETTSKAEYIPTPHIIQEPYKVKQAINKILGRKVYYAK
jgi:hypothetical protein